MISQTDEYFAQPDKKIRPDLAYNLAVIEVDRMLQCGKVTEQQLHKLQENFAEGLLNIPKTWAQQKISKGQMVASGTQFLTS